MKSVCLTLLYCVIVFGCKTNNNENKILVNKIAELVPFNILKNKKVVILIPRAGCTGCIDGVTKFVYDKKDSLDNILVIFTGVIDKKLLQINTDSAFLNHKNVIIDNDNLFMKENTRSLYPRVFYLDSKRIQQLGDFDPHEYSVRRLLE